jgi:hypothetical protein
MSAFGQKQTLAARARAIGFLHRPCCVRRILLPRQSTKVCIGNWLPANTPGARLHILDGYPGHLPPAFTLGGQYRVRHPADHLLLLVQRQVTPTPLV